MSLPLRYFKRYRMEVLLESATWEFLGVDSRITFEPWNGSLIAAHAEANYLSFQGELDAQLFPSFTTPHGCLDLMHSICLRSNFCPAATWLAVADRSPVGTIQGLMDPNLPRVGAIQNLGVVAAYRGKGIGQRLLALALAGFRQSQATRVYLEVTAQNLAAIRLYRRYGFRCYKTLYKVASPPPWADTFAIGL